MTVHLTMRSKCTCSNNTNNNANTNQQGFKPSNLFSNYINNSNNNLIQRNVTIVLLDSKYLDFSFDNKTTVFELFEKVCSKLKLKESDVFGLAQKTNEEYYFLPNDEKLYKYATKCLNNNNISVSNIASSSSVKLLTSTSSLLSYHSSSSSFSSNNSQVNSNNNNNNHTNSELEISQTSNHSDDSLKDGIIRGSSCFKLYFRVQFFLTDPLLLRDGDCRQLYYYQLKENFLNTNHSISQERYFELAALALQADYGNFNHEIHKGSYFDINLYFPKWIIDKLGENFIMKNIPSLHAEQSRFNNNTQKSAQIKYCSQLSNDEYPYNLHFYSVFKTKDEINPSICLGIAPKGILVFEIRSEHDICLICTFPWSSVTKLNFDKKKFEVTIHDSKSRRYSYYTNCEKRSKYLFELSKITHSFTVNIFSRLADQKTLANYVTESYKETMFNIINDNKNEIYQEREICAPNMSETTETKQNDNDSSRETRPTRKRLATFESENSEQLLRKYSSLSGKTNNYFQISQQPQSQKSPKQQTRNLVEFEPCLSISSTNLLANQAIQNSSPSTTSSSSVSSVSVTSLPIQKQILIDGVPMKMIKSSVPSVNLHTAQSCYAPNNNNQYYYQQHHILLPTNAYQNGTNLDYRQTFTAFSSNNKQKQQAPPPPAYHTRTKDLNNRDNYENYENKHVKNPSNSTPPYVEYKKPPTYEESIHRIKHSKDSSISSTCTSPEQMDLDENTINSNNSNTVKIHDYNKQYEKNNKLNKQKLDSNEDVEFEQINHSINRITIDEKNLEQIRIKAASMSLPLLTALCSDISLIRSLTINK